MPAEGFRLQASKQNPLHADRWLFSGHCASLSHHVCFLENQFKFKLHGARSPLLIEGTCRAKALVQHFGGLSEECVC